MRPFEDRDYPALAALIAAANTTDAIPWLPTATELRIAYEARTGFDAAADLRVVEVDGELIAAGGVERVRRQLGTEFEAFGHVAPAHRRRGHGRRLLEANLARAQARAAEESPDDRLSLSMAAWEGQGGDHALAREFGFEPERTFFTMRRPDLVDVPDAPMPDGLEIRRVDPSQHRAIFDAEAEAFADHWNGRKFDDADFRAQHEMPDIDTDLWVVAWAGDEVAGVVQTWVWSDENEQLGVRRGWLEHISVRRPWRRRGLARALTAEALRRLRAVGIEEAMLGVDSESLTGALGLYEGLGFAVASRVTSYRRPLVRP